MIAGSGSVFRTSLLYAISAFLLAGFFAVRNVSSWPARISYPGEESYEGCALAETVRLAERVPIYAAPSAEGFAGATYGPLYFLTGSRLIDPEQSILSSSSVAFGSCDSRLRGRMRIAGILAYREPAGRGAESARVPFLRNSHISRSFGDSRTVWRCSSLSQVFSSRTDFGIPGPF